MFDLSIESDPIDFLSDKEIEAWPDALEQEIEGELEALKNELSINDAMYLEGGDSWHDIDRDWFYEALSNWCSGTLESPVVSELMYQLDEGIDADYLHVFFDIPNYSVTATQRQKLHHCIELIGSNYVEHKQDGLSRYCNEWIKNAG